MIWPDPHQQLDPELASLLVEHSPRLIITNSVLVRAADSHTGWVLLEVEGRETFAEWYERTFG